MEPLIAAEQPWLLHWVIQLLKKSVALFQVSFLTFKLMVAGSFVAGKKSQGHPKYCSSLMRQNLSCPFTILVSPFESNTKIRDAVRKVLGKWNMTHSCNTYCKWAQHVQTQRYPGLRTVSFFAYFACLTRDFLPRAFPSLSRSNFSLYLQNATNMDMIKKSPFGSINFFYFVVTWK